MVKKVNKKLKSMMTALDESMSDYEKMTEIQGLTFMYAMLKGRNYTKLHYGGKYLWK